MLENYKTDEEIIAWLKEEYASPFSGWDFSYLKDRRIPLGKLPWDYTDFVSKFVQTAGTVLDMDTGGGEVLAKILSTAGRKGKVSAVEGYAPNVPIAQQNLAEFGVEVHDTSRKQVKFNEATFDLVIDRHGGSLSPEEIFRIVRPGGRYITEQVGDKTNKELRALFHSVQQREGEEPHNAKEAERVLANIGFVVSEVDEYSYPVRFVDVGALVFYLRAIPWEVPDFSVRKYATELVDLHQRARELGYAIDATYHAYKLVARKPSPSVNK